MPNKLQKYEAAVKLSNNKVVVYHNINTGLKKFDSFIKNKFNNQYLFYTVRRIETKEILGTFKNDITAQIKLIRVYLPIQRNVNNSGYFVRFPFQRMESLINRNLFFSDKIIFEVGADSIVVKEEIYQKAIITGIEDIKSYLIEQNHIITYDEIKLGSFQMEKLIVTKKIAEGTKPDVDFP